MRMIAFIEEAPVIRRILEHVSRPACRAWRLVKSVIRSSRIYKVAEPALPPIWLALHSALDDVFSEVY
jgi:hypothetical protein